MEEMVYEAATSGSTTTLQEALDNDPLVLDRFVSTCFGSSPLHIAAFRGHTGIVTEILHRNPELADAVDSCHRSPLHLASARGHLKIVEELVSVDPDLCLARDRDGRNPLHLAVMKGRDDVLKELVQACPHAAHAVMDRGETMLHLCVRRNQLECLKVLLDNIRDKEFVNAKDGGGSTILHMVVANTQVQVLEYLLNNSRVDVNATNGSGHTALDLLAQIRKDVPQWGTIRETLMNAGAVSGKDLEKGQWLAKKREALMVVASLIATIAFQAAVSPPGGVWQDNKDGHRAGEAIMASNYRDSYPYFLRISTVGFVASLSTILLLMSGFPFKRRSFMWILVVIMWLTITAVAVTYAFSIVVVTPKAYRKSLTRTIVVAVVVWCSVMAFLLLVHTVRLIKKAVKEEWSRHLVTKRLKKFHSYSPQPGYLKRCFNSV